MVSRDAHDPPSAADPEPRDGSCQPAGALDVNFWAVFESAPDAYLLLAPDPPHFARPVMPAASPST